MRRLWPLSTAVLCVLLIVVSFVASGRPGKTIAVVEHDGERTTHRRKLGLFSSNTTERDRSIHVSADLRKQLARVGLQLSPPLARNLPRASRQAVTNLQDEYSVEGETSGTPKDAIDFYARRTKGLRRHTSGSIDQLYGTCPDGRTQINVSASDAGGRTYVYLNLTVPH